MKWIADEIIAEDVKMYRLYRFGDAGRCGNGGVAKAAAHHGVGIRAWWLYEQGKRRPPRAERDKIARWLTAQAKRLDTPLMERESAEPVPEPVSSEG